MPCCHLIVAPTPQSAFSINHIENYTVKTSDHMSANAVSCICYFLPIRLQISVNTNLILRIYHIIFSSPLSLDIAQCRCYVWELVSTKMILSPSLDAFPCIHQQRCSIMLSLIYFLLPLFTCHSNYTIHSFPSSASFSLLTAQVQNLLTKKKLTYCKRIKSHLERLHLKNRASNHHTLLFLPFLRFNEMFNQYSPNQQSCDEEAL